MTNKIFALVDCNNFYASCEKLFRPDLATTPVVVLSNNDGCVIARSKEAKALGIKMATPFFEAKALIQKHSIVTFSSNYALYADLSARVMQTLEELAPAVEVYSIDEAFLELSGLDTPALQTQFSTKTPKATSALSHYGFFIRERILNWVGMTVCVGIAPTKTLAKLANHAAKAWPKTNGVVDLTCPKRQRKLMALVPVSDVWGIGRKLSARLKDMNIHTALDLASADPKRLRRQFSIVLEKTVRELNGESCFSLEDSPTSKKAIVSSKSFGERITCKAHLQEAIASYVHTACQKLRREHSHAKQLTLFLRTSPFSRGQGDPYYSTSQTRALPYPSEDTRDFLKLASELLDLCWKDGHRYMKAGVVLSELTSKHLQQVDLFSSHQAIQTSSALMSVLDQLNHKKPHSLFFASSTPKTEQKPHWAMKQERLSPAYTTCWKALPKVS